jgi:predicted phage terminase large subunit-like protein
MRCETSSAKRKRKAVEPVSPPNIATLPFTLADVDAALAYNSLHEFVCQTWDQVERTDFKDNWHIKLIAEHLEAVTRGEIRRLIMMIPPRCMKSLLTCVFWPTWDWLHQPSDTFMFSAYATALTVRDNVRARRLITGIKYQNLLKRYQPKLKFTEDQNTKIRYDNTEGGYRIATSVEGSLTGEGAQKIVVDDPHNMVEIESDTRRNAVLTWWDEAMSTRLNDPKTGSYVIIHQRGHQLDLIGHILAREPHLWTVLKLPMRNEGSDQSGCNAISPRKENGELLWPERFGKKEVDDLEVTLGPYAFAAQMQQNPSPRGGGLFNILKFHTVMTFLPSQIVRSVRYWDKAGSVGKGCYTVGVLMHLLKTGQYLIEDVVRGRWGAVEREQMILSTAQADHASGRKVDIWLEREPGSGGLESAQATIRNLAGYQAYSESPTGSKEERARPFAAQVGAGNVLLLDSDWVPAYKKELETFPVGAYKDQVDGSSGAFNKLADVKRAGVW